MDDLLKCPALHQPGLETNLRQRPDAKACLALVALFALLLGSVALAQTASFQTPPAGSPSGMDQAIALITEALVRFQNVQDYECRLMKRERVKDELLPESAMTIRVRNKPFSVYLRSELPEADRGLAVCYVESRNRGMMRVHPAGMLGVLGFWSVSPHDPRAFEKNRHCITDAGLGNLLVNTARYWDMERRLNQTLGAHHGRRTMRPCLHAYRDDPPGSECRVLLWLSLLPVAGQDDSYARRRGNLRLATLWKVP